MAHEMIQAQKKQFAKDIIQKLSELQKKSPIFVLNVCAHQIM